MAQHRFEQIHKPGNRGFSACTQAIAKATIDYPRAKKKFPLLLQMEKRDQWRITKVINTPELLQIFAQAEEGMAALRDAEFKKKNDEQQKRMNAQFHVTTCHAAAYTLSDKNTSILGLRIAGENKGPHTIHNMNLLATIEGHNLTVQKKVNVGVRIQPGQTMEDNYIMQLGIDSPEEIALMQSASLTCTAQPRAMALGNGEVLHIRLKDSPSTEK